MHGYEWLAELRLGDAVIVVDGGGRRSLDTVARFTPTQVLLDHTDRRFRRSDGGEVGGGTWTAFQLSEATPQAVAQLEEARRKGALVRELRNTDWRSLSLATLEAVVARVRGGSADA